jgi:3-oxoacyl-[acyl-carrier-protein] synthase III
MLNSICKSANIDKKYHLYNVDTYGICGAAGAPSVLSENWNILNLEIKLF